MGRIYGPDLVGRLAICLGPIDAKRVCGEVSLITENPGFADGYWTIQSFVDESEYLFYISEIVSVTDTYIEWKETY